MTLEHLHNRQAEQAVLAALLYDQDSVGMATELHPSDFAFSEHCEIFSWILREVEAGRKPTAVAIVPVLANMRIDQNTVGRDYIFGLIRALDRGATRESLSQVKGFSARRQMDGVGKALQEQARVPGSGPREVSLQAIEALNKAIATERRASPKATMVFDAARDVVDTLDDPDDNSMISTGLKSVDAFIGGWPRGELSIVAGRPSMGKSALLVAMARRAAKKNVNVMIFSLEMPRKALACRMLSDFAFARANDRQITYADILRRNIDPVQKQRLAAALEAFKRYPVKIDDQRGLSMPEIQLRAMQHADELARRGERLDIVMVDHVGKIRASERYRGNMTAETTEKSDALMSMAYELDAAVVAAHQLNRATEGREDKHPTPADLRDSGALEQDVHTLIFPYRQAYYLERSRVDNFDKDVIRLETLEKKKNILELLVAKCRNGACGTIELFVDMPTNHVEDLSHAA